MDAGGKRTSLGTLEPGYSYIEKIEDGAAFDRDQIKFIASGRYFQNRIFKVKHLRENMFVAGPASSKDCS